MSYNIRSAARSLLLDDVSVCLPHQRQHVQFPQLQGAIYTQLQSIFLMLQDTNQDKWDDKDDKGDDTGEVWKYNIHGELVLFTVLAWPCYERENKV